jgi:predicted deacetylase
LVVSVHDVAPASAEATRQWVQLLGPLGIPLSLLVIPGPWRGSSLAEPDRDGRELAGWLRARQASGDEVSVHGWTHRAEPGGPVLRRASGALLARGAGEFWALDRASTAERTRQGVEVLEREGLEVVGSTPPGWLAGGPALRGLGDAGLRYSTDHRGLRDLRTGRRWSAPALCQRPASPAAPAPPASASASENGAPTSAGRPRGVGLELAGRGVLRAAHLLAAAGRSVRIGLHPADLDRPRLAAEAVDAVRRCLAAGAEPVTYAEAHRRLLQGVQGAELS